MYGPLRVVCAAQQETGTRVCDVEGMRLGATLGRLCVYPDQTTETRTPSRARTSPRGPYESKVRLKSTYNLYWKIFISTGRHFYDGVLIDQGRVFVASYLGLNRLSLRFYRAPTRGTPLRYETQTSSP